MLTISDDPLAMTRSRSLPAALTLRAKIVLGGGPAGVGPHTIGNGAIASSPIGSRVSRDA
jgi:hypothetical protein